MLICSAGDTTTRAAAAAEVTAWANFSWSAVFLQGVSYVGHTGEVNGYTMWPPPGLSRRPLRVALVSVIHPICTAVLNLTLLVGDVGSGVASESSN